MKTPLQTIMRSSLGGTAAALLLTASLAGCGDDEPETTADAAVAAIDGAPGAADAAETIDGATATEDLDMTEADFECILGWDKVRRFRVTNMLGHLEETLAVAGSANGGAYPVGTVLQLIPTEAMVKRRAGFNPASNDWEFFALEVNARGTTIAARGTTEVVNQFNGNCFDCHVLAEPQWDLICEQTHGCEPLPIGPEIIEQIQNGDPRCP
jgi:hypothetical protein